jgi:hypothetical protein
VPWWAWFVLGAVTGASTYLVVGNALAFRRRPAEAGAPVDASRAYIATPGARRTVNFKGEDEVDGEEVGAVFITDEDDPDFVHELGWMRISDARELARGLRHPFNAD